MDGFFQNGPRRGQWLEAVNAGPDKPNNMKKGEPHFATTYASSMSADRHPNNPLLPISTESFR